jgi:hypothetical protein
MPSAIFRFAPLFKHRRRTAAYHSQGVIATALDTEVLTYCNMINTGQAKIARKERVKISGKQIVDLVAAEVAVKRTTAFQRPFQAYHAGPEAAAGQLRFSAVTFH